MLKHFKIFFVIISVSSFAEAQTFGFGCLGFVGGYGGFTYQQYDATGLNDYIRFSNQLENTVDPVDEFNSAMGYRVGLYSGSSITGTAVKRIKITGVLLLIAPTERQLRIEVGYGLEPVITDGRAGSILDKEVVPFFKNGDYDQGVINGAVALENYIRENTPPSFPEDNPVQNFIDRSDYAVPAAIGLGIFTIYLMGFKARTKSFWFGGLWGAIVGFVLGLAWGNTGGLIGLPIGLGLFGFLLDLYPFTKL